MKYKAIASLIIGSSLLLAACGEEEKAKEKENETKVEMVEKAEGKIDLEKAIPKKEVEKLAFANLNQSALIESSYDNLSEFAISYFKKEINEKNYEDQRKAYIESNKKLYKEIEKSAGDLNKSEKIYLKAYEEMIEIMEKDMTAKKIKSYKSEEDLETNLSVLKSNTKKDFHKIYDETETLNNKKSDLEEK